MDPRPSSLQVIANLIGEGWIPLRQMAVLLGMNELRGIYARQKGKNKIPTVKIGGIERVYADEALEAMRTVKHEKQPDIQVLINLYEVGKREQKRREKQDA